MRLGIVVTDDRYGRQAEGLLRAAAARGWEVRCFLTDKGAKLLGVSSFADFIRSTDTWVAVCELSLERLGDVGIASDLLEDRIVVGGQYQNAELVKKSERVLVF
ncbi:MAG: hypothetical protein DWQ09_16090 [Proteobacteria bacterium]|nr:MAG: hypothetical protein DWQ09_16090 [Pseudomonadota bacterium]